MQFLRLNDGVTVDQFEQALKQAEGPALAMTKQVGGVGAIHPGGTASAIVNLPAGRICHSVPDSLSRADHVAHHAKGMIKSLKVEAGKNAATEPTAGLAVRLQDYCFTMPESLPAGATTIKVTNDGPEPHEFNILRLEKGKTIADVCARKSCQIASGKSAQRVQTGVQASLNHAARALAVSTAPGTIHCAPEHLSRCVTICLQLLSTVPLPIT